MKTKLDMKSKGAFYKINVTLCTSLLLSSLVFLGSMGTISSHYAFSQLNSENGGNGFVSYNLFGGDFTMQIPQDWTEEQQSDGQGAEFFCSGTDCHNADEIVSIESFNPTPGSYFSSVDDSRETIFNGVLQDESTSGFQNVVVRHDSNDQQSISFTFHDSVSGQDYIGIGVHMIINGRLYVAHFLSTKEAWNSFVPIFQQITSTWHYNRIVDGGPAADSMYSTESKILHDNYCSNMNVVANLDVNRAYQTWDPGCNAWR